MKEDKNVMKTTIRQNAKILPIHKLRWKSPILLQRTYKAEGSCINNECTAVRNIARHEATQLVISYAESIVQPVVQKNTNQRH